MRTPLLTTPSFTVYKERIKIDDTCNKELYYLEKPHAVLVVLHTDEKIGLLKVMRHLVDGVSYELPGGRIDVAESPEDAAKRELREETGISVTSLKYISATMPLPSITSEKVHIFSAQVSENIETKIDQDARNEGIKEYDFMRFCDIPGLIKDGGVACSVDGYAILLFLTLNGYLNLEKK